MILIDLGFQDQAKFYSDDISFRFFRTVWIDDHKSIKLLVMICCFEFFVIIYIYREREKEKERGACGVMVIVVGNGHNDRVQILDEADCISHSTNTLGKGMNLIILPPAMGNGRTDWVLQPWWGN